MTIRLTGMASNLDTDSMVKELVKASSTKKDTLTKQQTKLGWKQTAWSDLNTKIYNFYNKTLDNLRYEGSFKKKKTTVADSNIAKVIAGDNAVNGSQTLAVTQLAKSGYLTGGKLAGNYTSSSTMKDLGALNEGESASIDVNGTTIEFNSSTSIGSIVTQMNKAGVTASFDEKNQRFFISAKESGEAGDFTITANNANGLNALAKMQLLSSEDATNNAAYRSWIDLGNDSTAYDAKVTDEAQRRAEAAYNHVQALKRENENLASDKSMLQTEQEQFANNDEDYLAAKDAAAAAGQEFDIYKTEMLHAYQTAQDEEAEYNALNDKTDRTAEEDTRLAELTAKKENGDWEFSDEQKKLIAAMKQYDVFTDEMNAIDATIASNNATIADKEQYYTATEVDGTVTVAATSAMTDQVKADFDSRIAAANAAVSAAGSMTNSSSGAARIMGTDAKILLNGAEFTSSSNSFSVNGLTITAESLSDITSSTTKYYDADGNEVAEGTPGATAKTINEYRTTSINTSDDVDAIYDMIKDFISQYNTLINEMDSLYNASSAKGYEPLTSDEKDAMSETEVKDWEKKIKDALLRKDSTLGTTINAFKESMMKNYTIGGKDFGLSTFGINTMSYFLAADNEHGAYHIDGNKDDANVSGETDKLKAAIANNPEEVAKFFNSLANGVHDAIYKYMKRNDYSSVNKVYNDKQMQKDYDDYTSKIKKQETKLKDLEDRYYKQFTAMEKAMTKLNSTQTYITNMFG